MDEYIGFDVDDKKTISCIITADRKEVYDTIPTTMESLQQWLKKQRQAGDRLFLTFEVSGASGQLI